MGDCQKPRRQCGSLGIGQRSERKEPFTQLLTRYTGHIWTDLLWLAGPPWREATLGYSRLADPGLRAAL
ncbi:hypothetical protein RRG08_051640 [Elysia crispata]|uniref:Uncharacterized protein n=1 Tax=Elysia crispata TaxID=231223 RepID=A0AAE1A4I2_9GAST|nr:hypothetical protein RRG08_051640 [Elysia crispata]